jgi:hypothetical protein
MTYYYNPEVKLLLLKRSEQKVQVCYNDDPVPLQLPLIGPRPPYYVEPRYVQEYPVI